VLAAPAPPPSCAAAADRTARRVRCLWPTAHHASAARGSLAYSRRQPRILALRALGQVLHTEEQTGAQEKLPNFDSKLLSQNFMDSNETLAI